MIIKAINIGAMTIQAITIQTQERLDQMLLTATDMH